MTKQKKQVRTSKRSTLLMLLGVGIFVLLLVLLTRGRDIALLNPKGLIADEQYRLLITSTSIMLAFAALVLFFIYFFAWKYRETDKTLKNIPPQRAGRSKLLIFLAWASPISIFIVLSALMLPATQKLEPQRSIASDTPELTVRVIAMRWKWLFLYPEQDIATINFVQIPVDTPVRFELTADEAPMNGFWIPHLGGMLYSMTEHVNPLNLMGHTVGDYDGGASEINGHGFASMRFTARVSTKDDFDTWSEYARRSPEVLDQTKYAELLKPSEKVPPATYHSPDNEELFNALLEKYSGSHNHYNADTHTEHNESEGHH